MSTDPTSEQKPMTPAERRRANILARSGAGRDLMDIKAPVSPPTNASSQSSRKSIDIQAPSSEPSTEQVTSPSQETPNHSSNAEIQDELNTSECINNPTQEESNISTVSDSTLDEAEEAAKTSDLSASTLEDSKPEVEAAKPHVPMTAQEKAAARRARILALGDRRMALVNGEIKTREARHELTAPVDVSEFLINTSTSSTSSTSATTTSSLSPASKSSSSAPAPVTASTPKSSSSIKPVVDVSATPYSIQQRYSWWENCMRIVLFFTMSLLWCLRLPYEYLTYENSSILSKIASYVHTGFYILDSPVLSFAWSILFIELSIFLFFYFLRATNPILRKENAREEELMAQHRLKQQQQQQNARAALIPKSAIGQSEMEASLEKMFSQVDKISGLVDGVGPGAGKAMWYLGKAMAFQSFARRTFDGFCFSLFTVVIGLTIKECVQNFI